MIQSPNTSDRSFGKKIERKLIKQFSWKIKLFIADLYDVESINVDPDNYLGSVLGTFIGC